MVWINCFKRLNLCIYGTYTSCNTLWHTLFHPCFGIIYDTHNAKIYKKLCDTKTFRKKLDMQIDYTEEIKRIALKIKTLRKERKLTVQELAYRCDIERSNLSRLETGRSNPTIKTLCIICNALDVPLRALIE